MADGGGLAAAAKALADQFGEAGENITAKTGEFIDGTADKALSNGQRLSDLDESIRQDASDTGAGLSGAKPPAEGTTSTPDLPKGDETPTPTGGVDPPKLDGKDPADESTPPGGRTTGSDPIDLSTGEMVLVQRDLALPGLLGLVLERVHISSYRRGQWFGRSWASTLDQRVEVTGQAVLFATADGVVLHYPVPEPELHHDQGRVLPEEGARWPLSWDRDADEIRIEQPETGRTLHFPAEPRGRGSRPLAAVSDRNGNRITFVRDADGVPTDVFHSGGYHVVVESIATSAGIRVEGLRLAGRGQDSDTRIATFAYNALGQLTDVIDSSGQPLLFEYDRDERITQWTDRSGHSYRYHYGRDGRVVRTEGTGGFLSADFVYDPGARTTAMTDSLGHTAVYHWNARNQVVKAIDALGGVTLTEQDRYGRLLSRTDPLGRTLRITWTEHGDPVRIEHADGTTTVLEYNALRRPTTVARSDGSVWRYTYDERGNLLSTRDPSDAQTSFEYGELGQVRAVTDALGRVTRIETDRAGLSVAVADPLGATTRAIRDGFGRITTLTDPLGATTTIGWTVAGKPLWRVAADGTRDEWVYDDAGRLTEQRDRAGGTTRFEYGPFDRPTARVDPSGARYEFGYDLELRLTSVTNARGEAWQYAYDALGSLTSEIDFNNRPTLYKHDAAGQLVERTNGAGQTTTLVRDVNGRVVERRTPDAEYRFEYDRSGRLATATGPDGSVSYTRDALGRVLQETVHGRSVHCEYDAAGYRVGRVTPAGIASRWAFDDAGRPESLVTSAGSLAFQHDAAGREIMRTLGPGAVLSQTFDQLGRLSGQAIWAYSETESGAGAESGQGQIGDYRPLQQRTYTYRPDGAPTEVGDTLRGMRQYTVDPVGRVTAVSAETWTETYAYDAMGNLALTVWPGEHAESSQDEREISGTLTRRAGRTTYEHDAQGRVVRSTRRTLSGQARTWQYTWSADDRLVRVVTPTGTLWQYTYDAMGRRTGKRRLADDGSVAEETLFSWEGTRLAEQTTCGPGGHAVTLTWDYAPGTHRPVAQTRLRRLRRHSSAADAPQEEIDRAFHAIVTDLVGTPTELVSPAGEIAWYPTTSLWGGPLAAETERRQEQDADVDVDVEAAGAVPITCPLRFPGQYQDAETGLNYNHFRYYDPRAAHYLTADPLGLIPGPNDRAYVGNPLLAADPLGLDPQDTPSDDNTVTVYRYGDQTNPHELLPKITMASPDVQAEVAENMKDPAWAADRAEAHMQGDTTDTPFISVAGDYHAAAATTDDWLHDISRQAPDMATFRVPADRLVMPQPGNVLSISETEMLFNGRDLQNYLVKWQANPYLGKP
jgi:RHS repeat-associated protein